MSEIPDSEPDRSPAEQASAEEDARLWREVFQEATPGLRAFLRGRLSQDSDVDDCLQVVFVKMIERGSGVAHSARRAWLFRVAANESARLWRRKAATDRMLERQNPEEAVLADPTDNVILNETTEQLQQSLQKLPEAWQQVVRLRINENLTFQQIADQLGIPLGTALTQMRRALERLKNDIESDPS